MLNSYRIRTTQLAVPSAFKSAEGMVESFGMIKLKLFVNPVFVFPLWLSREKAFGTHSGAAKFHERVKVHVPPLSWHAVWLLKSGTEHWNLPCTFWDSDLKYLQRLGFDVSTAISLH